MAVQIAEEIKQEGTFATYLGGPEEAVYVHQDKMWIVREKDGQVYSVWCPEQDILYTQ